MYQMHTLYLPDGRGLILKGRSLGMTTMMRERLASRTSKETPMQQVSASRIVMYVLTDADKIDASFSPLSTEDVEVSMPAMVVKVDDAGDRQAVTLRVLSDSNGHLPRLTAIPFSEGKEPGTWHWPPRV